MLDSPLGGNLAVRGAQWPRLAAACAVVLRLCGLLALIAAHRSSILGKRFMASIRSRSQYLQAWRRGDLPPEST